jgi:hypothetical protein
VRRACSGDPPVRIPRRHAGDAKAPAMDAGFGTGAVGLLSCHRPTHSHGAVISRVRGIVIARPRQSPLVPAKVTAKQHRSEPAFSARQHISPPFLAPTRLPNRRARTQRLIGLRGSRRAGKRWQERAAQTVLVGGLERCSVVRIPFVVGVVQTIARMSRSAYPCTTLRLLLRACLHCRRLQTRHCTVKKRHASREERAWLTQHPAMKESMAKLSARLAALRCTALSGTASDNAPYWPPHHPGRVLALAADLGGHTSPR